MPSFKLGFDVWITVCTKTNYSMKAISKALDYQSVSGAWRTLRPCSVMNVQKLAERYNQLVKYLNGLDQDSSFEILYMADDYLQFLCNECLTLGGIDPVDCSLDMVLTFLMPHALEDGTLNSEGVLMSFNFPAKHGNKKYNAKDAGGSLEALLASIWLATEDLAKSLELLEKLCPEDLSEIMAQRAEILMPEAKKLRKQGFEDAMDIISQKGLIAKEAK